MISKSIAKFPKASRFKLSDLCGRAIVPRIRPHRLALIKRTKRSGIAGRGSAKLIDGQVRR